MENKKVFIGNLNFEVTESDLKTLLSKYGTVINIRMHNKKGYAFAELSNADEAANVIRKLDGMMYKQREIHASPEMKPGKAKKASVKKYKERGKKYSDLNYSEISEYGVKSVKFRDSMKSISENSDRNRPSNRSHGKSGIDRWATERPADLPEKNGKVQPADKRLYHSMKIRDDERGSSSGYEKRDYTKHKTGKPVYPVKKKVYEKNPYSARSSRNIEKQDSGISDKIEPGYKSRERKHISDGRPNRNFSTGRPEGTETHGKEWTKTKSSGSSRKVNDNWREKPDRNELPVFKTRDSSKQRSVSGTKNRFSGTARHASGGGRDVTGSLVKKIQGRTGNKKRYDRD